MLRRTSIRTSNRFTNNFSMFYNNGDDAGGPTGGPGSGNVQTNQPGAVQRDPNAAGDEQSQQSVADGGSGNAPGADPVGQVVQEGRRTTDEVVTDDKVQGG